MRQTLAPLLLLICSLGVSTQISAWTSGGGQLTQVRHFLTKTINMIYIGHFYHEVFTAKGVSLAFQEVPNRAFIAVFAFPFVSVPLTHLFFSFSLNDILSTDY